MNSIDIAKIAGVSRSTVSRVINNYDNVPDETRKKIQQIIKENNYVPHASARMLAGVKNRVIGLFIIDMKTDTNGKQVTSSSYFTPFTGSVIENASKMGYNVLVSIVSKQKDYKKVKEIFYNKTVSGGIFIGEKNGEPEIKEIINSGCRVALLDQAVKSDEEVYNKCIIVNADNYYGAYKATNYLIGLGHSSIAHIVGISENLSGIERFNAYKNALTDAGIAVKSNLIVKGDFTINGGYNATKKLLQKEIPTAIFCGNDMMAIGAMQAIEEANLNVPEDISIVGFDDIEVARYINPTLTTVRMKLLEMASIATNTLITSIESNSNFSANYTLPIDLIERNSCKALK
ncbi:LacI family DNA-binding transcriptional regulator [Clostridium estertheticum]|uniref:Transcriptional regulator n=1 Tax=Clostridium estertheticum subsp. estertheticum TaxID=1552 RepID=A0A1J0GG51_9CLOT|nr:LacI family DNA-binding transcriptional regulator [Clostridium estertheticum]APC40283.1 transcriptional regulator [Clostridium estertheticum subsp. estertheticum]MBU3170526.1 LacI family transcriptional regulator [Clostridium estertheticum]MBZ9617913.1 LacI family transcriptional regulator [Clostridium estertheticum subsp. laramiense]WAG73574.1 LacI family transcriptional regulator [Clostridium estertheticum]